MKLFYAILLHLSAGLWTSSLVMDVLHLKSGSSTSAQQYALSSFWCMTAGAVTASIALGFGLSAYYRSHSAAVEKHLLMSMAILIAYIFNSFYRLGLAHQFGTALPITVTSGQFILSALSWGGWLLTEFMNRSVTFLDLSPDYSHRMQDTQ